MDTIKFVNKLIDLAKMNVGMGQLNASIVDKNELQKYNISEVKQLLSEHDYSLIEFKNSPFAAMPLENKMVVICDSDNTNINENNEHFGKIKIGRNDPCPCGSGKKYKHCCGKS